MWIVRIERAQTADDRQRAAAFARRCLNGVAVVAALTVTTVVAALFIRALPMMGGLGFPALAMTIGVGVAAAGAVAIAAVAVTVVALRSRRRR